MKVPFGLVKSVSYILFLETHLACWHCHLDLGSENEPQDYTDDSRFGKLHRAWGPLVQGTGASYTGHGGQLHRAWGSRASAPRRPLKSVLKTAQSQLPFFTWFGDSETHFYSPPKREISWKTLTAAKRGS